MHSFHRNAALGLSVLSYTLRVKFFWQKYISIDAREFTKVAHRHSSLTCLFFYKKKLAYN